MRGHAGEHGDLLVGDQVEGASGGEPFGDDQAASAQQGQQAAKTAAEAKATELKSGEAKAGELKPGEAKAGAQLVDRPTGPCVRQSVPGEPSAGIGAVGPAGSSRSRRPIPRCGSAC